MTGALLTLLNAPTLAAYTASALWGDDTIYAIAARHARATPAAFAVRDRNRRLTYPALVAAADRLAASLAGHGVRSGERVAVWLPSRVETAIALLACSRSSYVCCPSLHRDHRVGEIIALVDRMRAAAVIAQPGFGIDADRHDLFAELADRDFVRAIYRIGPADAATAPFDDLAGSVVEIPVSRDANQVMYLPFTSGTTGEPKGVLHSDNTLLATPRMMVRDGVIPQSGYGMTETCSHQYTLPDDMPEQIIGTCGRCCEGYEIRIWRQDNPDVEAAPGEIGQIGGRGASLMLGYFDDQAATEAAFNAQGWFMTGDLGWVDDAGYLRITGRLKDVIIRGGRNIYPARIEALAITHDAVEKAAAFAVADQRRGERV